MRTFGTYVTTLVAARRAPHLTRGTTECFGGLRTERLVLSLGREGFESAVRARNKPLRVV
jgi:hypothetical protein